MALQHTVTLLRYQLWYRSAAKKMIEIIDNDINSRCKSSARNVLTVTVTVTETVNTLVSHCWWRHNTGCASQIKDILNKNFIVTGFVNVGSNTFRLTDCAKETFGNLTKNCFSILGGANGIGKNKANEELKHILTSVEGNSCINKILTCIPYKFDLHEWSVMCEYCS
jgi:hypothetical protein